MWHLYGISEFKMAGGILRWILIGKDNDVGLHVSIRNLYDIWMYVWYEFWCMIMLVDISPVEMIQCKSALLHQMG